MSPNRTVLITDANRGIGFAILQALALRSPSDHYVLGCRGLSKGEAAIQELHKLGITSPIEPIQIDVTSDDSLRAAVQTVTPNWDIWTCWSIMLALLSSLSAPDFSDYRSAFSA